MRVLILAIFLSFPTSSFAAEVWFDGKARSWADGDTPVLSFRLKGIDAPEKKQLCEDAEGECYACGKRATEAMKSLGREKLRFRFWEVDRYGRPVVSAYSGDVDIQLELVRQGWAVVYRRYVPRDLEAIYIEAEAEAKRTMRGMWQGTFILPNEWRKGKRLACE